MSKIKLRYHCKLCGAVKTLVFSEDFQEKFKAAADRWPYPLVHPHNDHWAIIYLDESFVERGIVVSKIAYSED